MLLGKITKYQYFNSFISVVLNFLYDASHIIIRNQTVNFLNTIYYFRCFPINLLLVFHYEVLKKNTGQYVETCVYMSSENFGKF